MSMERKILRKEDFDKNLYDYYIKHYGENELDEWFEQPALNVWCFKRENKIITLKCHMLYGVVEEKTDIID